MKTNNKENTVVLKHIEDERLVAFLDGEMDAGSHTEIRGHLESCWDCRCRLSNVERSIEKFLKLRQEELLPPELPPSGEALDLFRTRLAAHRTLTPAHSFFKGIVPNFRQLSRQVANALNLAGYSLKTQVIMARATVALGLISIVAAFVLFSGRFNTVSASELFRLSIQAQAGHI